MKNYLTRRTLLVGSVLTVAAAGLGSSVLFATSDPRRALAAYIRAALPGVRIDEVSLQRSVDDFLADWSALKRRVIGTTYRLLGVEGAAALDPRLGNAPRLALTHFLTNSNFFNVADPRKVMIIYLGSSPETACRNPFAAAPEQGGSVEVRSRCRRAVP